MNIQKSEQQDNNFDNLYVGFGDAEIVSICPTKDQLLKLYEVELGQEEKWRDPDYISDKDGVTQARIDFYAKSVKTKKIDKFSFFIKDFHTETKNGGIWMVNNIGDTQVVKDESELFDNFKSYQQILSWVKDGNVTEKYVDGAKPNEIKTIAAKTFRKAFDGEVEILNFFKNWIIGFDYRNVDASLLLDMKKVFAGNFKELQSLVGDNPNIVLTYSVKTTEEGKEYQVIESRHTCPIQEMKYLNNFRATADNLSALETRYNDQKLRKKMKKWELYVAGVTNSSYPIKNYFIFQPLASYDNSINPTSSNEAIVHEPSSSSY